MNENCNIKIGNKIAHTTIIGNIVLSIIKLVAGILGKSNAMISDALHSLSDVISTFCVLIGLKLSQKPEDADHPYGHEKFEPILTKVLAFILFGTALLIGYKAIQAIQSGYYSIPSRITIYAAIISIGTKEWMYRYTLEGAKKINSSSLKADAWHHRTDALSSIGTLIGVIGARMGFPICDPIASIVICLIILKASIDIFMQAANQLVDHSADEETINEVKNIISHIDGVQNIDSLKTRVHSNRVYIDLEIGVCKDLSLIKAHEIAENVHHTLENKIKTIKHCTVHVNPK